MLEGKGSESPLLNTLEELLGKGASWASSPSEWSSGGSAGGGNGGGTSADLEWEPGKSAFPTMSNATGAAMILNSVVGTRFDCIYIYLSIYQSISTNTQRLSLSFSLFLYVGMQYTSITPLSSPYFIKSFLVAGCSQPTCEPMPVVLQVKLQLNRPVLSYKLRHSKFLASKKRAFCSKIWHSIFAILGHFL